MAVREINIGVLPTACWIEYAHRRELEAATLADPDMYRAERLASRIVTFQNDVAGFNKDARRGWPNAVLSVMADDDVSLPAAFSAVAERHDLDVSELEETCDRLARRRGEAARTWARGLKWMVAGLARWQSSAPRYTATLPGGEAVRVQLDAFGSHAHS